jgi:ParB-like chromosome segregation protein Spo0J
MAKRLDLQPAAASYRPDDNVLTYRPDRDGRNANGERLQYIPLRLIHPSPYQTRVVRDPEADRILAEDIEANGYLHVPVTRPSPSIAGVFETVAGHRRVDAGWLLAREGRGAKILRGSSDDPGDRCLGVIVRPMEDLDASERTIVENHMRTGLRPWEEGRALLRHKQLLAATGQAASRTAVAVSLDLNRSTIAAYLQVAERLTPEVRAMAADPSVQLGLEPVPTDDASLCLLPLEALQRAARAKTRAARAKQLRRELLRVLGDDRSPAGAPEDAAGVARAAERGFQINIRKPLNTLSGEQAGRYLEKLADTSLILMGQANPRRLVVRESPAGARIILVPNLERLGAADAADVKAALAVFDRVGRGG